MKTAKDIMTSNPKFIGSGEDIKTAIQLFFESNIHYAPVVTPTKEVLGLLSEMALIKASLKHYLEPGQYEKVVHHKELFEEATFIEDSSSLDDVVKAITKTPTNRVLVRNKQGLMIGIIAPKDILALVSGQTLNSKNLREELNRTQNQTSVAHDGLEESLKVYQNLFENSPYMMHSVNQSGKILLANKRIHEVLGYDSGELIGKTLSDLYPKAVLPDALSGLKIIKEQGHHDKTYTTMVRKNGEKIRIDIASSSLRGPTGDFYGTISISREVDAEELLKALHGLVATTTDLRPIADE